MRVFPAGVALDQVKRTFRGVRSVVCPALVVLLLSPLSFASTRSSARFLPPKLQSAQLQGAAAFTADALAPLTPLDPKAWLLAALTREPEFGLPVPDQALFREHYLRPWAAGMPDWRRFAQGRFGTPGWDAWQKLSWNDHACEAPPPHDARPDETLSSATMGALIAGFSPSSELGLNLSPSAFQFAPSWAPFLLSSSPLQVSVGRTVACPAWRRPRPVTLTRYGGEHDTFRLLECDGSVSAEAVDRLSVLSRPPGVPRPELPLPLGPTTKERGEWLPFVRMVHPRLVWLVQKVADAFPRRAIHLVSGYRRTAHSSHHRLGRALDLSVRGISNVDLFRFCRTLNDVGCGYYPHHEFVHMDVREYGSHHVMWIDISQPGAPSEYVPTWPGLIGEPRAEGSSERMEKSSEGEPG